ncbi:MAG: phage terminase large subunit family protein [Fusobacteriaceae bacterium]|nr:phage terminase large subunit family protein [Fusobacteriaceae bacterium]
MEIEVGGSRMIPQRTINLVRGCLELLETEEKTGVLEWAQANMYLPSISSESGKMDVYRTPYMAEIYARLEERAVRQMSLMFGAQMAKTTFLIASIFRNICVDPCPMIFAMPTEKMAVKFSKEKLQPTIDVNEVRKRILSSDDTILHKGFKGGFLSLIGTKIASNLAMSSCKYAYVDEIDRIERSAGIEGDPFALLLKRLMTYEGESKVIATGTPTEKGKSNIEKQYLLSSQAIWVLPCPHCGEYQALEWPQVKWEGKTADTVGDIRYECKACGALAPESAWKKNNQAAGRWLHKIPERAEHLGYYINQLASSIRTWDSIVKEWLKIQNSEELDKKENLKVFINTVIAELWEDVIMKNDYNDVYKRREKYEAELPDEVCLLTMGVDVQKDWMEYEVIGWGPTGIWGIEHRKLYGNLEEKTIWEQLDLFRRKEYKFRNGEGLFIYGTAIDTGYSSQRVYDYAAARKNERVYATKGSNDIHAPVMAGATDLKDKSCKLYTIGVGTLKDTLYSMIDIPEGSEGYLHFPKNNGRGYDEAYCKGLMSEHKVDDGGKVKWEQHYKRNEPLDCRNYGTVPLYINGINVKKIAELTRAQQKELSQYGYIGYDAPQRSAIIDNGIAE